MRRIELAAYRIPWRTDLAEQARVFDVKGSAVSILFNNQTMTPRDLLKVNTVAEKLERANGHVLLENAEYDLLMAGLEGTGANQLTRDAVEFVRRILEAPSVEVEQRRRNVRSIS